MVDFARRAPRGPRRDLNGWNSASRSAFSELPPALGVEPRNRLAFVRDKVGDRPSANRDAGMASGLSERGRKPLGEGDQGIGLPLWGRPHVRASVREIVIQQLLLDPQ